VTLLQRDDQDDEGNTKTIQIVAAHTATEVAAGFGENAEVNVKVIDAAWRTRSF